MYMLTRGNKFASIVFDRDCIETRTFSLVITNEHKFQIISFLRRPMCFSKPMSSLNKENNDFSLLISILK